MELHCFFDRCEMKEFWGPWLAIVLLSAAQRVVAEEAMPAASRERFSVHAQFSYVEQDTSDFKAPYAGANSLDANGRIAPMIEVRDGIAKRGSGRRVPMHPQLAQALMTLRRNLAADQSAPEATVLQSLQGGPLRANSIVNWFIAKCCQAGLQGCSSHSGRRTFITKAARAAHRAGASLRDVQMLAGHRSIETTQGYIDGDTEAQRKLVSLI